MRSSLRYIYTDIIAIIAMLLLMAEVIVIFVSWIGSALSPDSGIHSLLSPEGVRWFVGDFASVLATPVLVYIILVGITIGIVRQSGVVTSIRTVLSGLHDATSSTLEGKEGDFFYARYSERLGLRMALATFVVIIIVIALFTFLPHAVLINSHGYILGSSFSRGIIPMMCFCCSLSAVVYGAITSRFHSLSSYVDAVSSGITISSRYILLYLLAAHLFFSIRYILPA